MLLCVPIKGPAAQVFAADLWIETQEIDMVGNVARWGTNALLIGMAIVTYALFVLAK
jgi:hypothetical protein